MKRCALIALILTFVVGAAGSGCARAARDTSGFALRDETVVNAPFEETWHTVKQVLREQGYEVYTRDKRGAFVAYTPMKRTLWVQPRRTKFTVELARIAAEETAISVESIRQVYGVTLLTHPNWHDRQQRDPQASQAILEAIQAKVAGGDIEAEAFVEEMEAEADVVVEPENEVAPADEAPVVEEAETVN
jgi:hypothetical protein